MSCLNQLSYTSRQKQGAELTVTLLMVALFITHCLVMAVLHSDTAICGAKPSKEWGEWEGGEVTCERCLTRLGYINHQKAKVNQEALDPWFRD